MIFVTYGGSYHTTFQPTNLFSQPCHRTEVPLSHLRHISMGSSCGTPEMHPRILQGSCEEGPSLEGLLLRGCHVTPSQAGVRAVSLPGAIPLQLFLLMSALWHSQRNTFRHAQPFPTCPKTSKSYPSTLAHDFLGTAWFSGYGPHLGIAVAYTKPPQCSLASPFLPLTLCYHGTSAQLIVPFHACQTTLEHAGHTHSSPSRAKPSKLSLEKIPSLLHFIPASSGKAGIRLTWVHACVHLGALTLLANFKDIKDNYFLPTSWQQAAGWQTMLDAAFHRVYLQQLLILLAPFSSQL